MPRGFREDETERIKDALAAAGEEAIMREGARRLRIEDLSAAAGIAKGSFYRFYASKEDFILDLLERAEDSMRGGLEAALAGTPPEQRLERFCELNLEALRSRPWLARLMRRDELAYLTRAIGPERMAAHAAKDDIFIEAFLRSDIPPGREGIDLGPWVDGLKGAFYLIIFAEELGPFAPRAAAFIIKAICRAWREDIHGSRA
jgi:AcrR family transcriptional regulator